jgi:hypothetical protein
MSTVSGRKKERLEALSDVSKGKIILSSLKLGSRPAPEPSGIVSCDKLSDRAELSGIFLFLNKRRSEEKRFDN